MRLVSASASPIGVLERNRPTLPAPTRGLSLTVGLTGKILPASQLKTAHTNDEARLFFEAMERRRTQALVERDIHEIDALHADQYQLVTPSGKVFTKSRYIAAIVEAPFYTSWEIEDFMCRPSSDMAVVRYKATLGFPSGSFLTCWHTDLYEKLSGSWVAVWSQATEVKKP